VPLIGQFMEDIENPRLGPQPGIPGKSHFFGNPVGGKKTDPEDIRSQTVGIFLQHFNGSVAVLAEDPGGIGGADPVGLQEEHDRPDFPLLLPGLANHGNPFFADALHFLKAVTFGFDDLQGGFAELFHHSPGHDGSDPLDQPRPQIFLDPIDRRRYGRLAGNKAELFTEPGMVRPFPLHPDFLSRSGVHHAAHHGHRVPAAGNLHPGNGIAVFFINEGDALNMSLISITFPIIIIVLSRVFFGERISAKRFAGILIVVAGVVFLLTGGRPSDLLDVEFAVGDLLMLVTAAIFASYSLLIRRRPASLSLTTFQFSTFVVGVVFLAPFFVWERAVSVPLVLDGLVISAVLYIGIFASLAAFVSWNKAIERIGAAKAGLVYYLMPVFSGLSAWLLLGEPLGIIHLVSMAIIVVGIFLASKD